MKVICAPDSFKESISAIDAAHAIKRGVMRARPDAQVDLCPMADGGEGTVQAMLAAALETSDIIEHVSSKVMGPLGNQVEAQWGMFGGDKNAPRTAVIEVIMDGLTGLIWLQRPFAEEEKEMLLENDWPPVLRRDFLTQRLLTEEDVLEIQETKVR